MTVLADVMIIRSNESDLDKTQLYFSYGFSSIRLNLDNGLSWSYGDLSL